MEKKQDQKQKRFIKNLIKTRAQESKIMVELRKGEFEANDENKNLSSFHYKESDKDFLILKSAIFSKELKAFLKKVNFYKHKFIPEQDQYNFRKLLKRVQEFFQEENFPFNEIPEIKVDFILNDCIYTFDLTNKEFYLKKNSTKKNLSIMYKRNQFRLMIDDDINEDVKKNVNEFNNEKLKNLKFIRIKFKNEFLTNFMNYNFYQIFQSFENSQKILDFCKKVLNEKIIKEKIFKEFWCLLKTELKLKLTYQIECQLNYEYLLETIQEGDSSYEYIIETFFNNFFELYEDIPNFELFSLDQESDQDNLKNLTKDFKKMGF